MECIKTRKTSIVHRVLVRMRWPLILVMNTCVFDHASVQNYDMTAVGAPSCVGGVGVVGVAAACAVATVVEDGAFPSP